MLNFNGNNFEFQQVGNFCMYNSQVAKVTAQFTQTNCFGIPGATCNCMVRIDLPSSEFIEFNTCSGSMVQAISPSPTLACSQVIPLGLLFDLPTWNSILSTHPKFKCAQYGGYIVIKTTLGNALDDILVKFQPNLYYSNLINEIQIYPSDNYFTSSQQNSDKCLCGLVSTTLEDQYTKLCKQALIDQCLNIVINQLNQRNKAFVLNTLINDCVLDLKGQTRIVQERVGIFQKEIFELNVVQDLQAQDTAIDRTVATIGKMCDCRGKKLSKFNSFLFLRQFYMIIFYLDAECILKGFGCNKPFSFCI